MKKKLILSGIVAVLAIGGAYVGYATYFCTPSVQATTMSNENASKPDECCKADEAKAQTASMSMGCCEEKKETK